MRQLSGILFGAILSGCATTDGGYSYQLWEENDAISPTSKTTDANYTQGLQFSWTTRQATGTCDGGEHYTLIDCQTETLNSKFLRALDLWRSIVEANCDFQTSGGDVSKSICQKAQQSSQFLTYGFGQQFYTPNKIDVPTVQPTDRPFAGLLYLAFDIAHEHTPTSLDWEKDERVVVSHRLGVVGPSSQSDAIQTWWHDEFDHTTPEGWHLQHDDELAFRSALRYEDRFKAWGPWHSFRADLISLAEAHVGTVYSGAEVGITGRFGYQLPRTWSAESLSPAALSVSRTLERLRLYTLAGVRGRFVARDIFLDGNTFERSTHTVDRKPFVHEIMAGMGLWYGGFGTEVRFVYRSKQYETQREPHRFGIVTINFGI